MNITVAKKLSLEDLRNGYRKYLQENNYGKNTVQTACNDSFYLWKKAGIDVFWRVVSSDNFEAEGKHELLEALKINSKGDAEKLLSGYMSHLRRFYRFVYDSDMDLQEKKSNVVIKKKKENTSIPTPSKEEVEYYLKRWDELENYHLQEDALDKLFFELCPNNSTISDILIKVSTLNDFYSTNIFSVYPVAKHILSLNIDERLQAEDVTLVNDLMKVTIDGKMINFYSFATKYCSHHKPLDYPIYDSYVEKVLFYFRNRDDFSCFSNSELKNYARFKEILIEFRKYYVLEQYNLKLIDKYLWQLGKEYFPKEYGKKKEA